LRRKLFVQERQLPVQQKMTLISMNYDYMSEY
jgi:hypothetical protein